MNRVSRRKGVTLAVAAFGVFAVILTGCGEATEADPTPVKTWKITPAASSDGTATQAPSEATATPAATAAAGGTVLEIKGVSSLFDVEELEAPVGSVTIKFDNQDAGVVHNFHVFNGKDAKADDLAASDLEAGPIQQELTFTVEAGEYFYQCDAHPTTMKGTLKVS
ncbi:MAG: cupredoxin domain-containing protein [Chloroflexi bacterium]|nr:cupredoxin domain-containing protein [Chloroflexota bacterium]